MTTQVDNMIADAVDQVTRVAILDKTHYGSNIYAFILRKYYPGETVLEISGRTCKPARNPFTDGSPTLQIHCEDGAFLFHDSADPAFRGTPFDFAERYYNLSGKQLLDKINEDLHLKIGEPPLSKKFSPDFRKPVLLEPVLPVSSPRFSFYNRPVSNTFPAKSVSLGYVHKLISGSLYSEVTRKLRSITEQTDARKFKARNFDYVTFSGVFKSRSDSELIRHSGLLTIDLDHLTDVPALKTALLGDDYFETQLLFTSPSGEGLKWIVDIDLDTDNHLNYFNAIALYIRQRYGISLDPSGKDISRACFLCSDPNAYINPQYQES